MRRSSSLWSLLRDNPRFSYYGRWVALSDPDHDTVEIMSALVKLQGATTCYYYPAASASDLFADLEGRGISTDRHEQFWGGESALAASRNVLAEHTLPEDITVSIIDADTPRDLVSAVAELCRSCDVMPVPGSTMRGQVQKGICLVATDQDGQPVATGSSYMHHHPSSRRAKDATWGMLATREDRRGERIALLLGAQTIIHMWERYGVRGFTTGVRADNSSSQSLCNKLGVIATEWVYASCIDTELLGGSSITK